ncbi:MAG: hypothetical protein HWN68_13985 [Desulfobacterales bacterium]|nr:hypothetical protein [Desulfobacterales bacterium]
MITVDYSQADPITGEVPKVRSVQNKGGRPKKEEKVGNKVKAHIRYKNREGKAIPGTTTITGLLAKPALIKWANNLGLQGIDSTKYRDKMADIGILAHYLIMCHLREVPEKVKLEAMVEYSKDDIDKAENCVLSYFEWEKEHKVEPIVVETPLVSEAFQFGGTVDCFCKLDGDPTLLDFKTGKGIWPEMFYQLGAYFHLLKENGYVVRGARILRIGRSEDEGFDEKKVGLMELDHNWEVFETLRKLYKLINGR